MKFKSIILIGVLIFIYSNGFSQDAREISKKALDLADFDAMEMTSTLKIYDSKGHERIRQTSTASKKFGETTKIITKFIAPADVKGTGILVFDYSNKDDDMWIYLPALRKVRRIVSSEKGKSFMGSEFSNADMSKPNIDDYTYSLIGVEDFNGIPCWKVQSIPVDENLADETGVFRKIALIDKSIFRTYKVIYYDLDDELYKEMLIGDYEDIGDGKQMARSMEINNLQNKRKSILTIKKLQIGSGLSEETFSPSTLEK